VSAPVDYAAQVAAIEADRASCADEFAFVASFMHYAGENYGAMTNAQKWAVYCQGDGFGECSPEELAEINDGWDWSHVRDSSSGAVRKMAATIKEFVS
jgi:hypothetical protein